MQRSGCVACKGLFNKTERSAAIWHRFFVNSTRYKHRDTVFLSEAKLSKQVVRLLASARPCPRAHVTYRKKIIDKARSCAAFHKLPGPLISNGGLSEYCGSSMTRMLSLMLRCACARHQLALCRAHGCERPVAGSSTNTLRSSVLTSPLPTTSTRHCQRTLMSEKELLLSRAWRQDSRRTCITPACTRLLAVGCTTSSSNWPSRDASTASGSSTLPPKAYWQAAKSCPQCAFIRWPNAMQKRDGGLALLPYLNVWGCGGNRQSDVETRSRVELPGPVEERSRTSCLLHGTAVPGVREAFKNDEPRLCFSIALHRGTRACGRSICPLGRRWAHE